MYTFIKSASGIEVRFVYQDQTSCGAVLDIPRGRVISLRLTDLYNKTISPVVVTSCAAHELGHILGLGHTSVHVDLMGGLVIPAVPSTLDLYAVHLLADGLKERTIVTLPSHIPYMAFPGFVGPTVTGSSVVSATTTRTEASVRTETVGVQFGWNTPLMAIVAVVAILALGVFLAYRARLRGKAPAPAIQSQIARRYCPNCGAEISADAKFCMNCGVSGT